METFLQTYFLLKLKRYVKRAKASVLISSTWIPMMLKNLTFWFLNSYNVNSNITDLDLVLADRKTWSAWVYTNNILGAVKPFFKGLFLKWFPNLYITSLDLSIEKREQSKIPISYMLVYCEHLKSHIASGTKWYQWNCQVLTKLYVMCLDYLL